MWFLLDIFTWVIILYVVYRMPVRRRWEWFISWAILCVYAAVLLVALSYTWWFEALLFVPLVVFAFRTTSGALQLWRAADSQRCVVCDRRATHERYYGMYGDDVTVELVCRRHMKESDE